ncbi:MAG: MTH865 family protein [Desulfomonilaceae bacterium]
MSIKEDIRNQIIGALARASFPIGTPEALLAAFPQGADTKCKSGEIEVTAGEAGKLLKSDDFPFASAEQVAETILKRAGL